MKRILFWIILGSFLVSCGAINPFSVVEGGTVNIGGQDNATPVPTRPPYTLSPINARNVNQIQPLYLIRLKGERTEDLLAISPDKKWVAVTRKNSNPLNIQRLKWNPDGSFVPKGDGFTTFFLYQTTALAFSPDSMHVAVANGADNSVLIFSLMDLPDENNKIMLSIGARPQAVVFTKDNKKLIVGTWNSLQLWDYGTASLEKEIVLDTLDSVCSAAISPDGKILAAGSCTMFHISTWDIENGYTPLSQLPDPDSDVYCADECLEQRNIFEINSATGEIVSVVDFPNVTTYDPATGKRGATVKALATGISPDSIYSVKALGFASDGGILVMAANQKIQFIDAKNGDLLWHLYDPRPTNMLAISADSTFMVSLNIDGEMFFWGIPTR